MAWTTPRTWASGYVVLAADLNTHLRDNLNVTAPAVMTTAGDIIYASGSNTPARLAKDTNSTRSLTNTGSSNVPAWAQVALATGVSGTLPVGNGGTGATALTANGALIGNGTSAIASVDMSTKGGLLVGDGSGNPSVLAVGGTDDHVLTVDSGETTGMKWAAASAGASTAYGTYTGDGTTSKAITGTGFTVKFVEIWEEISTSGGAALGEYGLSKTMVNYDDGSSALLTLTNRNVSNNWAALDDHINALGSDGFTVDDDGIDTHPNKNGQVYFWRAIS